MTGFSLPDSAWGSFHAAHWEKSGTVPFATPVATPEESFACLVAASDRFRAGDPGVQLEFCIEHAQVLADVGDLLPMASDWSADGYAARVTPLVGGRRFGLVVEDVQFYDATLWLRLRDFLAGLFEHTGLPGDSCKATVFLGNYDRTPFGLHRGHSSNFMFVVDGQKRMRTWPDAYFRGREDLTFKLGYAAHNDASIVMDAGPGDVIFWPSDHWHIGESVDGRMSSAVSVALFMAPRRASEVAARATQLVNDRLGAPALPIPPRDSARHLAHIDSEAGRACAALAAAAADPALASSLRVDMLNRLTAFGFARPPRPLPHRALGDDDILRADPRYPILWMPSGDDDIVCSACGHAFTASASPHVTDLIASLNSGEPHRVRDAMARFSGVADTDEVEFETSPASVRAVLERLVALRALA